MDKYLNKSKGGKVVSRFFKRFFISRLIYLLSLSQESISTSVVCLIVKERLQYTCNLTYKFMPVMPDFNVTLKSFA